MALKLSSAQTSALAEKIKKDLDAEIAAYNKQIFDQREIFYSKYIKKHPILQELLDQKQYSIEKAVDHYLGKKYKDDFDRIAKLKSTLGYGKEQEIKNQIVLKTIEADNLDELIKSIKKEYL